MNHLIIILFSRQGIHKASNAFISRIQKTTTLTWICCLYHVFRRWKVHYLKINFAVTVFWELSVLNAKSSFCFLDYLKERLVQVNCLYIFLKVWLEREGFVLLFCFGLVFCSVWSIGNTMSEPGPAEGGFRPSRLWWWRPVWGWCAKYSSARSWLITGLVPRAKSLPVCSGYFYFLLWNCWLCALAHFEKAIWTFSHSLQQWKMHERKS